MQRSMKLFEGLKMCNISPDKQGSISKDRKKSRGKKSYICVNSMESLRQTTESGVLMWHKEKLLGESDIYLLTKALNFLTSKYPRGKRDNVKCGGGKYSNIF